MPRRLLVLGVALVLAGNAQSRPAASAGTIVSVAADGSGLESLSPGPGKDVWPTPSPDGSSVAFVHHEGAVDTVRIVGTDGSNERTLGGGPLVSSPYSIVAPLAWAPDGSELLVSGIIDFGDPRTAPIYVFVLPV